MDSFEKFCLVVVIAGPLLLGLLMKWCIWKDRKK